MATQTCTTHSQKILSLESVSRLRTQFPNQTIVLCHGVFDLIHPGHIAHLEEAAALGDILVVTITTSDYVSKKRVTELDDMARLTQLAHLDMIDYVAVIQNESAVPAIRALRPHYYVKGPEYRTLENDLSKRIMTEQSEVNKVGGQLVFTNQPEMSSTKLAYFRQKDRPHHFKNIASLGLKLTEIKSFLSAVKPFRLCVVGETIIDEWHNVKVDGLGDKTHALSSQIQSSSIQLGGAGIVAQHLSSFVTQVDLVSNIPLDMISEPNIRCINLSEKPIIKTRYYYTESQNTIFETKQIDPGTPTLSQFPTFDDYDAVLICDYGHSLLDSSVINTAISDSKRAFIGVMVQSNSSNFGFNLVHKYPKAHYYSMNQIEAQLLVQNKELTGTALVDAVHQRLASPLFSVTFAHEGAAVFSQGKPDIFPALSDTIVDSIGCGDAYFAFSTLAAKLGLSSSYVALLGSIPAGIMAQQLCNEAPVTPDEFLFVGKVVV